MTTPSIASLIAKELAIPLHQVTATVTLLDDGNTIPFIARYRKEVTGGLDEVQIRDIQTRLEYLRKLAERRDAVKAEIASQEKLTDELAAQLDAATTLQAVEDLYRPYKPKRQTRAQIARERGLEPLAQALLAQAVGRGEVTSPLQLAAQYLADRVPDVDAALAGARDIIAERVSDDPATRQAARQRFAADGFVASQRASEQVDPEGRYRVYYDFRAALRTVQPHQWLALQRGSEDGSLKVRIETPDGAIVAGIEAAWIKAPGTKAAEQMRLAIEDGYERLLRPSVEREVSGQLSEFSDDHAITVFAANLRNLLLQPPLRERAVMGIDPGFRTGCKVATVDPTGKLLHTVTIYPHPPQNDAAKARQVLAGLVQLDKISVIAIGNGTASRETEALAAELIQAGQSPAPRLRHGQRGGRVGLLRVRHRPGGVPRPGRLDARRGLDRAPAAGSAGRAGEDRRQEHRRGSLPARRRPEEAGRVAGRGGRVGGQLRRRGRQHRVGRAAGLRRRHQQKGRPGHHRAPGRERPVRLPRRAEEGQRTGAEGVRAGRRLPARAGQQKPAGQYHHPPRKLRRDEAVAGAGRAQSAHGGSAEPAAGVVRGEWLDGGRRTNGRRTNGGQRTLLHAPRSTLHAATDNWLTTATLLGIGELTLRDIVDALLRPGRDPREDLPPVIVRRDVLSIDDLREGMVLKGTVRNVVDFGAFVDIGVKQDGLVHVSKMAKQYVRNPHEFVGVGDVVDVTVVSIDRERGRVGLSMVG